MDLVKSCLIFPYSRVNGNAISVLIATLDIHPVLMDLEIFLPYLHDSAESLSNKITSFDNIILAFSLFSTQLETVRAKIQEYKLYYSEKNILVVAGGPHAIGSPQSMLMNGPQLVCTGEGEIVFAEIITYFLNNLTINKNFYDGLRKIQGIAYLDKSGSLIKTGKAKSIELDDYPPFSVKRGLIRPIEITRGCAWNCRFCQTRSKNVPVKHRSVEVILKYVKHTMEYFIDRRPDIRFVSPNALSYGSLDGRTVSLNKVETLLSRIRILIGPEGKIYFGSFPSEVRPETITKDSVALIKRYTNVEKIILGGQSGSDKVLELSERGHNSQETIRAAKLLLNAGFKVDIDIIFGLPGEGKKEVEETIEHMILLTSMGATIHSHTFMPLVGTPFANKDPGTVHTQYTNLIVDLQNSNQLSGSHVKHLAQAKEMADRRKKENKLFR